MFLTLGVALPTGDAWQRGQIAQLPSIKLGE